MREKDSNMSNMEAGQEMKLLTYGTFFGNIYVLCETYLVQVPGTSVSLLTS
jgi:hypothetical protein